MTTMKAIRHIGLHTFPELKDIERPTPAPTEVLLKAAGSGACHSDVAIFDEFGESSPAVYHREFTLGHEVTGWVEEVGSAVEGFEKGDAGLPPYHAIKKALLTLKQGGQCVLVIGLGGLGLRVRLADLAARDRADFHLLGHPARAARAGRALPRRLPRADVHPPTRSARASRSTASCRRARSPAAPSSSRTVAPRLTMPPRPPRPPNKARDNP
ncbi:alcohol dehydrogenase catalytic domain-containing protein [Corynebacterium confusum]